MGTADWALVISICSVVVSLAGFVWNVWSKFIYPKPKVRTMAAASDLITIGTIGRLEIRMSAINFGPNEITLDKVIGRMTPWYWHILLRPNRKIAFFQFGQFNQDISLPFVAGPPELPKKLEIGEFFSLIVGIHDLKITDFPKNISRFGFSDTFGRNHWCSRTNSRRVRKQWHEGVKATQKSREGSDK